MFSYVSLAKDGKNTKDSIDWGILYLSQDAFGNNIVGEQSSGKPFLNYTYSIKRQVCRPMIKIITLGLDSSKVFLYWSQDQIYLFSLPPKRSIA